MGQGANTGGAAPPLPPGSKGGGGGGGAGADPWTTSAGLFNNAQQSLGGAADAFGAAGRGYMNASRPGAMAGMYGTYMNPYTNDVIDRTTADMQRQGQMGLRDLGGNAIGQGAFGGARHGIAEGTLMGEVNRNVGDTAAQLRHQGYTTAMGLAGQDIQNQFTGAGGMAGLGNSAIGLSNAQSGLAGQYFGLGQNMMNQQAANGAQIQGIDQALIDQAAGMFDRYTGQPTQATMQMLAALSGNPLSQTGTTTGTSTPGTKSQIGAVLGTAGRMGGK